jgi:16S rRNA (guanine527-N7)-methyltransferase
MSDSVSRETEDRLAIYHALLLKWNRSINLVAPETLGAAKERHFKDSLQLLKLAPEGWQYWTDLGSGGGFPGLVIAIARPNLHVTLIESDGRKAGFLRTVAREAGVRPTIVEERIEAAAPLKSDVVSARALAPLHKLLPLVERHIASDGMALLQKGKTADAEIERALEDWHFDCEKVRSEIDPTSVILRIGDIKRARDARR